jgi:hypothetical protein
MDRSARAVLITVVGMWAIGIAILLVTKRDVNAIPLPLWAIPGATYTVLTGSIPGLGRRGSEPERPATSETGAGEGS